MPRSLLRAAACLLGLLVCTACPVPERVFRAARFPADFAFGTATAQWQACGDRGVDGQPVDSNWSRWAAMGRVEGAQLNPAGNGFCQDPEAEFDRALELGLDTFRLGLDWSRAEPEPDRFVEAEIGALVAQLQALRARQIEPVLTLYHWTAPTWVQNPDSSAPGGRVDLLADPAGQVVGHFEDFVRQVIPRVKDLVDTYTVINEPLSIIAPGYLNGMFPPGRVLDVSGAAAVGVNLVFMHARAYDAIRELDDVDADGDGEPSWIGLTMTASDVYPKDPANPREVFGAERVSYLYNDWILNALTRGELDVDLDGRIDSPGTTPAEGVHAELAGRLDFIGVQYYGPVLVDDHELFVEFPPLYGLPLLDVDLYAEKLPHNGMGREIRAAGLRDTLELYAGWGLPLVITENGTTTNLRPQRDADGGLTDLPMAAEQGARYLVEHLWELGRARRRGIDVRGYYHWTLSDNFEWVEGQHQHFGAFSVDFETAGFVRTRNAMGDALAEVVARRGVDEETWKRWVSGPYPSDRREVDPHWTVSFDPWGVPDE